METVDCKTCAGWGYVLLNSALSGSIRDKHGILTATFTQAKKCPDCRGTGFQLAPEKD